MNEVQRGKANAGGEGAWAADSMRLTLFFPTPRDWKESLFETLVGQPAEMEQTSKRPGLPNKLESGRAGHFQVNAVAQANRLDVHISVGPTPEDAETVVRDAEAFRDILSLLATNAGSYAPITRIGVGASLLRKCESKAHAYGQMHDRFPCLLIDAANSDDFMFQINRSTEDAQEGRINNIERWSYGVFERINIPIMSGPPEVTVGTSKIEGVKLDLDFNTAVDPVRTFDAETTKRVTGRLVESIYEKMEHE